jgi:hypothetical protein
MSPGDNDMHDGMPELEDYVDVVADLLMVNQPQNRGLLHVYVFLLQSAASCESRREEGRIVNMRSPETSSSISVSLVADSFAIYLQVKYSSEYS